MAAAEASPNGENRAAFLFAYRISDTEKFDEAYRQHLVWHREHNDHLAWYGWYVIAGARTGMFVDGTFGSDFSAIDRRPNLKEDAEHFTKGAAHYSTAVQYDAWSLWRDASTDFSLEERRPSPMLDALIVTPRSGEAANFERIITTVATAHREPGLKWTWYRATVGGRLSSYLVLIPRQNWAELEGRAHTLGGLVVQAYNLPESEAARLDRLIDSVNIETWRYRADLSLFPAGD